jgi:hypothetical protein
MDPEPRLHYQLLTLTADPVPSAQLHIQETSIQIPVYPKLHVKYVQLNEAEGVTI